LKERIGEILLRRKSLDKKGLEDALKMQSASEQKKRLGDILIDDMGIVSQEAFYRALAEQFGLEYIEIEKIPLDMQVINAFPFEIMLRYKFIPHKNTDNTLSHIIFDPTPLDMLDELELYLKTPLKPVLAKKEAVLKTLDKIADLKAEIEKISEDFSTKITEEDNLEEQTADRHLADTSQPIIRLINSIIFNAVRKTASDIHIESDNTRVIIKYRIDGVLQKVMDDIDKAYLGSMISRIKVMAELNLAEKRNPQDGRFRIHFSGRNIDFRVSILPTMHGEVCVIRILDKSYFDLSLDNLGFDGPNLEKFERIVRQPYGMVLVTGPTGSGKTTTLYSVINQINSEEDKIITIEDPIEYLLFNTTQIPVNEKKGLTFAKGLRSILRHDPDKIMVGEIRDTETANIAVQSALTGHMVYTTIHANNATDVINRLINMGVKPYEFVSALSCILAQRLVRKLCPKCKKEVKYTKEELEAAGLSHENHKGITFFEGTGCENCNNTGYSGRIGVFELMLLSDKIKEMILDGDSSIKLKAIAKTEGMATLREAGMIKVKAGVISLKELNRVTFSEGDA